MHAEFLCSTIIRVRCPRGILRAAIWWVKQEPHLFAGVEEASEQAEKDGVEFLELCRKFHATLKTHVGADDVMIGFYFPRVRPVRPIFGNFFRGQPLTFPQLLTLLVVCKVRLGDPAISGIPNKSRAKLASREWSYPVVSVFGEPHQRPRSTMVRIIIDHFADKVVTK